MTPEEEIAQKKKFDAIKADCSTKAHFKKFLRQYLNDSFYTIGLKIDTLDSVFRMKEIFGAFTPTSGWRKGIHETFKATILKELNIVEVTPGNYLQVFTKSLGMISNIGYAANKMEAELEPYDELIMEIISEYFLDDPTQAGANTANAEGSTKKLTDVIAKLKTSDEAAALLAQLDSFSPSKQKELSAEYGEGVTAVFKDDLVLVHKTSKTEVCGELLFLDEYVGVFNTVEELYDFLATRLTTDELGGLTAFRKFWERLNEESH
jgi:hypothetical protein